jgi:hypothetical protein
MKGRRCTEQVVVFYEHQHARTFTIHPILVWSGVVPG